ncbi:hypothetical protein BLI708_10360 [Bifidobacterium imperatoris]|uniref:Uncharacterized protein n=1 Tax=Bifidobacterium imperatoris TaxID=2020965 RepID=A0A2N5IVE3_9BIFI|nr:hypothetical protein [Bifidobacterium imperatoris]PLS25939.1 hypothetical protein Tam1G_0090 [Bifidobacterium imperatoris]QSY57595.1 hypothetical protein BLI708_10360 [Bifidobacterium imperatoris]
MKRSLLYVYAFSLPVIMGFAIGTYINAIRSSKTAHRNETQTSNSSSSPLISLDEAIEMTGLQSETIQTGLKERNVPLIMHDNQKLYPQEEVLLLQKQLRHNKLEALDELDELLERWGL